MSLRDYRGGALDGAWYALAAINDMDVNAAVVAEAARRLIFGVRTDIAVEGTAVTPASFDYAGLSVGVLVRGESCRSAAIPSATHKALQRGVTRCPGLLTRKSSVARTGDHAPG